MRIKRINEKRETMRIMRINEKCENRYLLRINKINANLLSHYANNQLNYLP